MHSAHTVGILELPFEVMFPFVGGDDHRERQLVVLQCSGDADFLACREIWRAALHFEACVHFGAVPVGHALRDEEDEDFVGSGGDLCGEFDAGHCGLNVTS